MPIKHIHTDSHLLRGLLLLAATLLCCLASPAPAATAARPAPAPGVWPLEPRPEVVARFDPPASRWGRGHRGVDLAGRPGQVVRASEAGQVSFAGTIAGRGVVVVQHAGGTRTTYEPVAPTVGVGDVVDGGAPVGHLQLFGSHCFPRWCLHWGLVEGRDHYLDPLLLVGAAPVVLLPLQPAALLPGTLPGLPELFPSLLAGTLPSLFPGLVPAPAEPPVQAPAQARGWAWR